GSYWGYAAEATKHISSEDACAIWSWQSNPPTMTLRPAPGLKKSWRYFPVPRASAHSSASFSSFIAAIDLKSRHSVPTKLTLMGGVQQQSSSLTPSRMFYDATSRSMG